MAPRWRTRTPSTPRSPNSSPIAGVSYRTMIPCCAARVCSAFISSLPPPQMWHSEAAPELEFAVDAKRLPAEPELEPHPLFAHPDRGLKAAAYEDLGQIGVAAVLAHPAHIVE